MRKLCIWLAWGVAALAQSPEAGRIERNGDQSTLLIESPRPLDSAAITIAEQFGVPVSVEDPPYVYRDDLKEVTTQGASTRNFQRRVFAPKGGRLEVRFNSRPDGSPDSIHGLLRDLVDKANAQFPFSYRIDSEGESLALVPTHTRDMLGRTVEIMPMLDRRITIPSGVRTIAESANLMAAELSAQTGLRVSCCQAFVAGIPWGRTEMAFEAPRRAGAQRAETPD
jgi:hypothetical protein